MARGIVALLIVNMAASMTAALIRLTNMATAMIMARNELNVNFLAHCARKIYLRAKQLTRGATAESAESAHFPHFPHFALFDVFGLQVYNPVCDPCSQMRIIQWNLHYFCNIRR
jgi:hypothetical protein